MGGNTAQLESNTKSTTDCVQLRKTQKTPNEYYKKYFYSLEGEEKGILIFTCLSLIFSVIIYKK